MNGEHRDRPSCHCHHHPDLIVVRRGAEGDALSALGLEAESELNSGELCRYLDGLGESDVAPIIERMALIRVDDPHAAANQLAPDIEASPVHGLGYMGHSGFKGDDFQETAFSHPEVQELEEGPVIAVVDSGLAPEEDLPRWLQSPSVRCDRPQDTDILTQKHPVSHGTFVTSVIRRVAPEHRVSMASARPDPGYMTTSEVGHLPGAAPQPTDELNVFGAIVRLVQRHAGSDEVVALNLSLGAYDCPDSGTFLLAMRIALEHWRENFDAEIFAAGGNSECEAKVYPAAWKDLDIRAVGAAAAGGDPIVWRDGAAVPDPGRDWITDWAPGSEILGLSGQSESHVIQWSGSSFACATATAASANGVGSTTVGAETWWTDQSVDYTSIPGLLI